MKEWQGRKKGLVSLLAGVTFLASASAGIAKSLPRVDPKEPKVTAQAAVVMDARTGELLWSRNPDQQRAPASITKILTAVLALESDRLDDALRVSAQAQAQMPSKLYLRTGQTATTRDLVYALMLKSANDAAVVVAEGLAGSVSRFSDRMNEWARSAGARSSQFRNPSGLPDSQHLSTARDLALILRRAVHVPGFVQVASATSQRISVASGAKRQRIDLKTKNRLLQGYAVPVIGKTGFTRAAGRCFAGYAERDGRALIVVVLGAPDMWGDTRRLFDWGFQQSVEVPLPVPVQVASGGPRRVARAGVPSGGQMPPAAAPRAPAPILAAALTERASAVPPASAAAPREKSRIAPKAADVPARVPSRPDAPDTKALRRSLVERAAGPPSGRAPAARITLAMGTGSSKRGGLTYFDEYPSRQGMVRRGCTGTGCERSVQRAVAR